ncbi:hypothetical protein NL676_010824 [Syzygium grande]|nr:hypothetical protein NL676_010824 [Syzygium grande]
MLIPLHRREATGSHRRSSIAGHQTHAVITERARTQRTEHGHKGSLGETILSRRIGFQKILHLHSLSVASLTTTGSRQIANTSAAVKRLRSLLFPKSSLLPKYSI